MSKLIQESAYQEFFAEAEEILQRLAQNLTKLETNEWTHDTIDSLYRDVHTLKGSAHLFGFTAIGLIAHAIEASLEPVRQQKIKLDSKFVDFIFKCLDFIDRVLKDPQKDLDKDPELMKELTFNIPHLISLATDKFGGDFQFYKDAIPDQTVDRSQLPVVEAIKEEVIEPISKEEPKIQNEVVTKVAEKVVPVEKTTPEKTTTEEAGSESSTIRVQVSLLDKLMNLVGEMVLTRNQVLQFARNSEDNDFLNLTQRLDLVTSELQDSVMKTRMQPIGSVFTKFQRVVRDLSRDLGKSIELTVQGAETELDKSLIEAIKDPLTHIVRNSCDHGVETPAVRKGQGKPEQGSLALKAYHEGGQVIIEIKDDGKGIDPKKIREKAIEKRVITSEKAASLSDKEAQELIFAPGFSTAEQVTSVSGRGVGMDVVRTNIEKVGGMIDLQSVSGKGTTLKLHIPLTLAIVPAMIIRSGQEFFAIPQVKLLELLRVDMEEKGPKVEKLQGQDVFRLRGQLLPLISCDEVMHPEKDKTPRSVYNIVVLNHEPNPYGLVVDEICDTADIVVKPLPPFLKKVDMFSGATIMGDGTVALIMDIQGIADHSKVSQHADANKKNAANQISSKNQMIETTEFLFFSLSHVGIYAIPLVLVQRLEEFSVKDIDYSGEDRLVKYREGILPLISLNAYFNYGEKGKDIIESENGKVSVIVVSKNNRLFGLVVNEVVDVLTSESEVTPHVKETKGLLGTIIAQDKNVITVIDAYNIIAESMGLEIKKVKRSFKKVKVLLAEDTIFFVKQIKKVLEKADIEVTHAPDGAKAFEILKTSGNKAFDFIISDIEMPNMNGFDLAKSVRAEAGFADIPMIALTTRFTEADQKRGKAAGFNKYLEKLKSDDLIEAIEQILGGRSE